MTRPGYCPVGNEPCQSLCDTACSWQGTRRQDAKPLVEQMLAALEDEAQYRKLVNGSPSAPPKTVLAMRAARSWLQEVDKETV